MKVYNLRLYNKLLFPNVRVIQTEISDGNMNTNTKFFPGNLTVDEARNAFLQNRLSLAERTQNFDGHHFFMADQKDNNGSCFQITNEYVTKHPNGWSDIPQDMLAISNEVPGTVIGHPLAGCPAVMAFSVSPEGRSDAIVCHCNAERTAQGMPMMVIDRLEELTKAGDYDIGVYVSACEGPNWYYKNYPNWANEFWYDAIRHAPDEGRFYIDQRKAIKDQLLKRGIPQEHIIFSQRNTDTDPELFSNHVSQMGETEAIKVYNKGRHFAGLYFPKNPHERSR